MYVAINLKSEMFATRPNYGNDLSVPVRSEKVEIDRCLMEDAFEFIKAAKEVFEAENWEVEDLKNGARFMSPGLRDVKVHTYTLRAVESLELPTNQVVAPKQSAEIIRLDDYRKARK